MGNIPDIGNKYASHDKTIEIKALPSGLEILANSPTRLKEALGNEIRYSIDGCTCGICWFPCVTELEGVVLKKSAYATIYVPFAPVN